MVESQERRRTPRVKVVGRLLARARASLDVRLLDLSLTGARIEHHDLLRPGSSCRFELPATLGPLLLSARIVRSTIIGSEQNPEGERLFRYESGLTFLGITPVQQEALVRALETLRPGDALGTGRLVP